MLYIRHFYYRIFHAHKPGYKTLSNWQNSPNIFAFQFRQIQNKIANCNILIKSQEFCQRNQFCSGNADNDGRLFINVGNQIDLDTRFLWLDPYKRRSMRLQFCKGRSGNKFFQVNLSRFGEFRHFPHIPVPEDSYAFVRTLDELILEFVKKNFEQKWNIQDPQSAIEIAKNVRETTRILKMKTVDLTGLNHKFKLELQFYIKMDNGKIYKEIRFAIIAVKKITDKEKWLILPLNALPWLRKQMAEMLALHDGTEQIEKEAPAQIPQQFFVRDVFNAHLIPIPNAISSADHSLTIKASPIEQKQQYLKGTGKSRFENLETRMLRLDHKKTLKLKLDKGWKGHKLFEIILKTTAGKYIDFPNILVPEDAYAFVRALDELILELVSDNFEQKLEIQADIPQSTVKNANTTDNQPKNIIKLKIVELIGLIHKFQLQLVVFIDTEKGMVEKEICIRLFAMNKTITYEKGMILPLQALPWLRNQMAEMLAKYDGTEQIEKEAPAQIPKHFFPKDVFRAPPTQKRLNQEGMRPQFANKNSSSFPKMQNSKQFGFKNQKMFGHLAIQQRTNLKQPKMSNKNRTEQLDPKIALERGIQTLFDFDDEEMEKYRRIAAKIKHPTKH